MWVLVETSKDREKPLYFHMMTGIGPKTTADIDEAAKFESKEEAYQSPAMRFSLTIFEAKEL